MRGLRTVRNRVALMAVALLCVPAVGVTIHGLLDRSSEARISAQAQQTLVEAVPLIDAPEDLASLALWRGQRIRVLNEAGGTIFVSDRDYLDSVGMIAGKLAFGDRDWPTLKRLDGDGQPQAHKPWFQAAWTEGDYRGCALSFSDELLVCRSVARVDNRLIEVTESSRAVVRALHDDTAPLVRITLFALPFSLLLGVLLGRILVAPAERLVADVEERRRRGSSEPLDWNRPDEFGRIARAFDALQGEISSRQEGYARSVVDLAHALKNPVAALRVAGDQLDREGPMDDARRARISRAVTAASARLDQVVSRFLQLSRAESTDAAHLRLDLLALLTGLVDNLSEQHPQARISVHGPQLFARADADGLTTALRNLIENARSFSPEHGEVRVTLSRRAQMAVIEVCDQGPGLPDDAIDQVFDRFYTQRPDGSGTGLGLSIVQAVARKHGGSISAANHPDGGAVFELRLPLDP